MAFTERIGGVRNNINEIQRFSRTRAGRVLLAACLIMSPGGVLKTIDNFEQNAPMAETARNTAQTTLLITGATVLGTSALARRRP